MMDFEKLLGGGNWGNFFSGIKICKEFVKMEKVRRYLVGELFDRLVFEKEHFLGETGGTFFDLKRSVYKGSGEFS